MHRIRIGARTNIQDSSVLHVTHENHPLTIGERGAQIGAGAVVAPGHRIPAHHLAIGVPARVAQEEG